MLEFLQKNGIVIALFLLLIIFFQTCGSADTKDIKKLEKQITLQQLQIDSLENVIVTEGEMVELIESTIAWETLRIEEISDKEHISINALKAEKK